jgi:hypothetical protein
LGRAYVCFGNDIADQAFVPTEPGFYQ